jgi:hypothetical protein
MNPHSVSALKFIATGGLATALMLSQPGCGGTSVGNPSITIEAGSYTSLNLYDFIVPPAFASVTELKLCFKRLRFQADNSGSGSTGDIEFSPGEVTISNIGNTIGTVSIPAGTYRRVEFDLEPNCPGSSSGMSVQVTNSSGSYTSNQTVTIKFEGTFTAVDNGQVLRLGFQNIVNALDTVTASSQIKDELEDASVKGSF